VSASIVGSFEGMPSQPETPLAGARRRGIVRIGDTVRRPPSEASEFAESLLRYLETVAFDGAPRFRGRDEQGREILAFVAGTVARHQPPVGRKRLISVATLIRRFHDATSGSTLAGDEEVVCHGELGPHNTLFVRHDAVALIDFDSIYAGSRLDDLGHAVWFFVPIGPDAGSLPVQAARLRVFCDAYGDCEPGQVLDALAARFERARAWYAERGLAHGEARFRRSSGWLADNRPRLLGVSQ
jgi:aminoglycoside phosphotransferase (APT) family kinase protein